MKVVVIAETASQHNDLLEHFQYMDRVTVYEGMLKGERALFVTGEPHQIFPDNGDLDSFLED